MQLDIVLPTPYDLVLLTRATPLSLSRRNCEPAGACASTCPLLSRDSSASNVDSVLLLAALRCRWVGRHRGTLSTSVHVPLHALPSRSPQVRLLIGLSLHFLKIQKAFCRRMWHQSHCELRDAVNPYTTNFDCGTHYR